MGVFESAIVVAGLALRDALVVIARFWWVTVVRGAEGRVSTEGMGMGQPSASHG
jgi:hypothetical protein